MAYYFRKIIDTKQNYNIYNKKLFAIILILQQQRIYTKKTTNIKIFINYKNLIYFMTTKVLNKKQT